MLSKEYREEHRERINESCKKSARKCRDINRKVIIIALGGKCNCCGESEFAFLTIDHVHNDGAAERRKLSAASFYYKFRRQIDQGIVDTENYQILCWNCNAARHRLGECPHKHL